MKTLQIPKFDEKLNFVGYKNITVKNKLDYETQMKVIHELPGIPQGYCPELENIIKPIEITRFYDSRQNTRKLKHFFISVLVKK